MLAAAAAFAVAASLAVYRLDRARAQELRETAATEAWGRHDYLLSSCERANVNRGALNDMVAVVKAVNAVFADFLDTSAQFRRAAGQPVKAAESVRARRQIQELATRIQPVPLVACEQAIPPPPYPRPARTT